MLESVAGINVSRETLQDLESFASLVAKWTLKINLISKSDAGQIWERHVVDSVQIYKFAPATYSKWVDMGSGGGFPGIVMAILGKAQQPAAQFILIESDIRKATFLRTAVRELNLNAKVLAERIEAVPQQHADIVSARALASLSGLLPHISRHIGATGVALLHKGQRAGQEIAEAQRDWTFDLEDHTSFTDPDARILTLQRIASRGQ